MPSFLATLRNTGNVRASCQAAGISRVVAYDHRDADAEFAKDWEDAMEDAIEALEAAARTRAFTTSDTLMIFLLKAHRPAKYRETYRHEVTGKDGAELEFTVRIDKANDNGDGTT